MGMVDAEIERTE